MTITMQQVLDTYADGLAEADFVAALDAELADRPRVGTVELTAAERTFLASQGVTADVSEDATWGLHRAAGDIIDLAAAAWTVQETAELLGVDASRIRHRISDRSLYAFKVGRQLRLPRWQFTDSTSPEPLPGLRAVLAVAGDVAPVELARFIVTPQPDLDLAGAAVTPRDWLLAGQDAAAVHSILQDLYAW